MGDNDTSLTMEDMVTAAMGIISHSVAWEFRYVIEGGENVIGAQQMC